MAIIYSYPLNQPKRDDLLIGTITYDEDAVNPVHGNPTVSFTIGSLLDLVSGQGNAQNLQQVTNIGNTTTNSIVISNNLLVSGGYYDSSNQPGSSGQVLSSTVTGTQWVNVAAQGVTSVGLSMPAAFTVTNSPITQSGTLTVTGAGTAAQYINGLGNLVLLSTLPQGVVTSLTTTGTSGASTLTSGVLNIPNYANTQNTLTTIGTSGVATLVGEVLNIPNYTYTLPVATDTDLGGVKIGYTTDATARNYAVTLDTEQMLVNVPWTDTPYVLPLAADGTRGGVQIGYTQTATRDYPVTLDGEKMLVTVPWTDTPPNPFQTIIGTGSDNTDSGILLSDSGGTVLILGDGSVTAAQTGNTITLTGTDTGITGVTLAIADSAGEPLLRTITNRELTLTSAKYVGGANVGYVPEGGTGTTYLKGDGTWASIPTGLIFKGTWDARNTAEGGASDGGDPDLDGIAGAADGWLYIVSTAGSAVPNGAATTPNSWNLGDWCVYDGTNWTRIPATNAGVTSLTTTDGDFVELTPTAATTGAITVTADLSATGTQDSTTFLRGDNTWDVPVAGVTSITGQEPITVVTTGGPTATTPRVDLRYVDTGGNTPNDDNVVTVALNADTDTLHNDDTLIINDKVDSRAVPLYNTVKKFTLQSLKNFVGAGNITAVNTTLGLTGGGAGPGALTLLANYETDANIVKASNFNNSSTTTVTGGSTSQTQITISAAAAANVKPGMIAGTSALSNNIGTVSVNDLTGLITFANNLGVAVGTGDTVYFSSVLFDGSELMFSTSGENYVANANTFVTTLPLSRIDLGLFNNDQGWTNNAGTLTGIDNGLGIKIDDGSTATPEVNVRYLNITGANNIIVASPYDMGTDDPHGNDLLLLNDETDGKAKKLSLTTLSGYLASGDITRVTGGNGLTGGGDSGDLTLDVEYTGAGNIILAANTPATLIDSGSMMVVNTNTGANASVNQIAISDVPLSYFSNTASGFTNNTGTLTGVTGAEPLYSVTTGGGSATVPQIKLRYNEDTAGNDDSIITAAPPFGAGTADPGDLIIISDQSTSLNETKKIALSQLGFGSSSGTVEQVDTGGGLTGGPFSVTGTISVMYTGTNNVILDATASTDHESTSRMMLNYDNGGGSIPVVNEMKLEDIQLGYFDNNLGWVVLGNTSTTALAGDTTTITTAQASEITANTAKVTDTGLPAVIAIADGTLSFGNTNVTAATVRAQIGAGTVTPSSTDTFTNKSGNISMWTNDSGYTTNTGTTTASNTQTFTNKSGSNSQWTNDENYSTTTGTVTPSSTDTFTNKSGSNSQWTNDEGYTTSVGTIQGVIGGTALSGQGTSGTITLNVRYAGTSSVIFSATDATGTDIDSDDVILYTDSAGATVNYGSVSDLPFDNGTVTSVGGTGTVSGLTLTGTVTSTGNLTLGGTLSLTSANVTDGLGYTPLQSETDTLADVTARGGASAGSTSTACSFTNTGAQQFGSGGESDVFLGGQSGDYIRFHTSSNGNTYFDMNCGFVYWRQASSTRFEQNMTNGTFTASGDVVAFGSPSDKRLKENIKPIESALDKAMKLQGVTFDWKKSDSILSIKKDIGFIAQDVQKVAPELVRENEDGYLSMRHQGIAPILLEAIKELKQEIEELKLNKCNCNN